eukprot:1724461-Rhodomonas_salina.1
MMRQDSDRGGRIQCSRVHSLRARGWELKSLASDHDSSIMLHQSADPLELTLFPRAPQIFEKQAMIKDEAEQRQVPPPLPPLLLPDDIYHEFAMRL